MSATTVLPKLTEPEPMPAAPIVTVATKIPWLASSILPGFILLALTVQKLLAAREGAVEAASYTRLIFICFGFAIAVAALQFFYQPLRGKIRHAFPIIAGFVGLIVLWQVITTGLSWLPLPYFPGPSKVWQSLLDDHALLFDSTWHSLFLLISGYALGTVIALVSGTCIGWFGHARYWGMPLLKIIGPIPATAWIPLAMVISPSMKLASILVIALSVWFPVTMLTASGISNTRASYLDVARTLGARQGYLIFRVAIPAAMPSIFIGLFMGLGASFLTLIVAETVGVHSGLGYYINWQQGYAEYGKVYAALVIMAVFFSTIMTLLFKVRDRVLVWQKGVIKW